MSTSKRPTGSADAGSGWGSGRSSAAELEAQVEAAEWRIKEAQREEAARLRLAELEAIEAGPVADTPHTAPMTDRAREAVAKMPAVLAELKRDHARVTKAAVYRRLQADAKTLNAWIDNGWIPWPPAG